MAKRCIGPVFTSYGHAQQGFHSKSRMRGYARWCTRFCDHAPHYPGTAYVLLHSLSHVLISEIALDCGYPASSLKERVYALSGHDGAPERCGILIYTATAGAQGTLGSLVGTATKFAEIIEAALERSTICSNDPICADHHFAIKLPSDDRRAGLALVAAG
jgi:hypothetical protein